MICVRDLIHHVVFCYDARHEHTSLYCNYDGHPLRDLGMGGRFSWFTELGRFLGCTAYFACPQGGLKGLVISASTLLSGVVWALIIIHGSALTPHLEIVGYVMTGVVAFLMCIQARQVLLSFVPGTFIGACATFAGQGDWRLVLPSLAVGLLFGFAMKNSGLWLASRRERQNVQTVISK